MIEIVTEIKGEITVKRVKEFKISVRQFLTKPSTNPQYRDKAPVPMRVMFGYITQETPNGVYVKMKGKPQPAGVCFHCGRQLTHPVSLLVGIGPECGKHYHESPMPKEMLDKWYQELKQNMHNVTWEGWLPRAHIAIEETGVFLDIEEEKKAEPVIVSERKAIKAPEPVVDQKLVDELYAELSL